MCLSAAQEVCLSQRPDSAKEEQSEKQKQIVNRCQPE